MMDAVQKALRVAKADGGGNVQGSPDPVGTTPPLAAPSNEAFVGGLYKDVLGRESDPQGMKDWLGALNAGTMNQQQVREAFLASPENTVQDLYGNLLNRGLTNDPGAAQWVQGLAGGSLTPEQVRQGILSSPEYQSRNPNTQTKQPINQPQILPQITPTGTANTSRQGMPLIYTPPPYKDYGATAAAFRVASGLENLPAPFYTLSPVIGGTPAGGETGGGNAGGTAGGKTTYQDILDKFVKTPTTLTGGTGNDTVKGGSGNAALADINALYQRYLGRTPERGAAESWFDQIRSGQMTFADVANAIKGSPEATVYGGYTGMLGRDLSNDPGARQWIDALANGQITREQFEAGVKSSPEYAQRQIGQAYQQYLDRAPSAAEVQAWANSVAGGERSIGDAIREIASSQEALGGVMGSSKDPVTAAYEQYLGRAPDAEGASAWNSAIASGTMTPAEVVAAIATSDEARARGGYASGGSIKGYADGGSPNYEDLVNAAYRNFLYRDPDEKGYNDWLTALTRGEIKPEDFESRFKGAGYEDEIADAYMKYLDRAPEEGAAANWIGQINDKSMTLDQVLNSIRTSGEARTQPIYRNVPTPDKFSERQGGRQYDINIGQVERIPKLGMMEAPINVKQEWENSEIARLQAELDAAKAAGTAQSRDLGGGGGSPGGGSGFAASDSSGTAGAIGVDSGAGPAGPPSPGDGGSNAPGERYGGRINAVDNALRMLKANRH